MVPFHSKVLLYAHVVLRVSGGVELIPTIEIGRAQDIVLISVCHFHIFLRLIN